DNPFFHPINESWTWANATLPGPAHDYANLDSSYRPPYETAPASWGLSVEAKRPLGTPIDDSLPPESQRAWVLCWDLSCGYVWWGDFSSDQDHVYVEPTGLGSGRDGDTDGWMEQDIAGPDGAFACRRAVEEIDCPDWL